jgi:ribosomal protein S12 methylthiotransferase accessory factor
MLAAEGLTNCRDAKRYKFGTHRTVNPAETVARVRPLMARMGMTRIADVTGLDRIGVPVVMVCRPNSRSLAVSQGKGIDLEAATASALMEAAELYHAEHIEVPLKLGSMSELMHSHRFVDVSKLARISGSRFDPHLVMLWTAGTELVSGQLRWVPFETVRANFTLPPPPGSGCFDCSSNGLASGNTLEEAVCHGICEVIERDATTLWNRMSSGNRTLTGLDLASVTDQACQEVVQRVRDADFDVAVWDTTTDVCVPSFFCLISDRRDRANHHGIGAGAHLAPDIALLRALTEAVQVRTTYISGARDDLMPDEYGAREREHRRGIAARLMLEHRPAGDFRAIADLSSPTFGEDLACLLDRLTAVGIEEVIAVDLAKPGIGIPVVRVVIPGMEGPDDHDLYAPGERALRLSGSMA